MKNKYIENEVIIPLLDKSINGIILLDKSNEIVIWNHWIESNSGISHSDAFENSIFEVFPTISANRVGFGIKAAFEYGESTLISSAINKDPLPLQEAKKREKYLKLVIHITPIQLKNDRYCLIQIENVTSSVHREDRLYQIVEQLKKTQEELVKSKEVAEVASKAKSIFLSSMSHELRTPLNAILGYSYILQNDENVQSNQKAKIQIIERSANNLLALITEILDLSKIEADKLELIPTALNLNAFLEYSCSYFKERADKKSIKLKYEFNDDLPPAVMIDEKRLQQILLNLIGNAIKFTDQGEVCVSIKQLKPTAKISIDECLVRFSVKDTGIGIDKDDFEELFKPFSQLNISNISYEGTGLGLNISHKLVNLMGGQIKVKSTVNKGSHFWFDLILPKSTFPVNNVDDATKSPIGYEGKQLKILVVDDIEDNRTLFTDMFESIGFKVLSVESGAALLSCIQEIKPDLILMDLLMPDMNGYQTFSALRDVKGLKEIPVVAISASVHEEANTYKAGFNGFLPKPMTIVQFSEIVGSLLEITWLYKQESNVIKKGSIINPPTREELEKLYELVQLGKMRRILEWANKMQSDSPEYGDFTLQVKHLASDFMDKELIQLVESYLK